MKPPLVNGRWQRPLLVHPPLCDTSGDGRRRSGARPHQGLGPISKVSLDRVLPSNRETFGDMVSDTFGGSPLDWALAWEEVGRREGV